MSRGETGSPLLHGRPLPDAARHVGRLAQLARVDRFVVDDGPARGGRLLRLVSGGGLELEVHPDRALDLGHLTADGVPLTWASAAGITSPALYETAGDGWGRTFGGGLLTTCGLDHVGSPVDDGGRRFPQHGRFHAIPAALGRAAVVGDALVVEGETRQVSLHQENLVLRRTITVPVGGRSVEIRDVVTNDGWRTEPHLVLYHGNLGWPLVAPGAVVESRGATVPVTSGASPDGWRSVAAPDPAAPELVYRHDLPSAVDVGDGIVPAVRITNAALGLSVELGVDPATLPQVFQWCMFRPGQYVLGVEPASTRFIGGRVEARDAGALPVVEPGQSVEHRLRFDVARVR